MTLTTQWGEQLDKDHPLPEHPRPQLVREPWQSLNGRWQIAFTPLDAGSAGASSDDPRAVADPTAPPATWDGEIIVPFSPETPLSGVGRTLRADETLWYRRSFDLDVPVPTTRGSHRVLLHFGAVDQSCRVQVNGVEIGGHTGGYLPFTLDITDALELREQHEQHEIVVAVRDVSEHSWLSRGKQTNEHGGIWYPPQSGIWQTVWLEVVPAAHIDALVLLPLLEHGPDGDVIRASVEVTVRSEHAGPGQTASVELMHDGASIVSGEVPVGVATEIVVPAPARLWSPDDPFLYDLRVTLGDDEVRSYVGLRTFGTGMNERGDRVLLLNGKPHMPIGLLDQGYWPDGGYTAASDEALAYDVQLAKDMGFTMLRKHIKIEPLRWYHHCDRLGMLVWQDHVSGGERYRFGTVTLPVVVPFSMRDDRPSAYKRFGRADAEGRASSEDELICMIEHLRNVPSISLWVPFNEGWGQFDATRIANLVRSLDPSRPVDHASGWHDQGAGDVLSPHIYLREVKISERMRRDGRVIGLSEYGGYGHRVEGHSGDIMFKTYRRFDSSEQLTEAFVQLHERQIIPAISRGLAATVYTELSDVHEELNGMVTFDRRFVKIPIEAVRAVTDRMRAAFDGAGLESANAAGAES